MNTRLVSFVVLYALSSPISADSVLSGDTIREAQLLLSLKGLYTGHVDGINGPHTTRAILLYEQQLGTPATGHISWGLIERLRMEAQTALKHPAPKETTLQSANAVTESSLKTELEILKRELEHTNSALGDTRSNVGELRNSSVGHFLDFSANLKSDTIETFGIAVAIFLAIVTIALPFLIAYISKRVATIHEQMVDVGKADVSASIYCVLSARSLDLYKHIDPSKSLDRYRTYLDMGANLATVAYKSAMYLRDHYPLLHDNKDLPVGKALVVNACVNNYVFYLGSRANTQDKQNALTPRSDKVGWSDKPELSALDELKKIGEAYESRNMEGWWRYRETLLFALLKFGLGQPKEIEQKVQLLFNDIRVPRDWTEEVKKRYDLHHNVMLVCDGRERETINLSIRE